LLHDSRHPCFTEFGIEHPALRSTRRHFCRLCLDWTDRRPHLAGAVGAAITKRYFDQGTSVNASITVEVVIDASDRFGCKIATMI
jgi:hypothetical protein